jgi:hypothetical protein
MGYDVNYGKRNHMVVTESASPKKKRSSPRTQAEPERHTESFERLLPMQNNKRTICINYAKEAGSSGKVKAYTKIFFEVDGDNEDKIRYVWAQLTIHTIY